MRDPLWIQFPRWLEESGVPAILCREIGSTAWWLYRKLIEIDCEQNLTPGWFVFRLLDVCRWTGISETELQTLLEQLENRRWIERLNRDQEVQQARIASPLPVELEEEIIRTRLQSSFAKGGQFVLRYLQDLRMVEKIERVVYLYQMLFGARFTPRIVEDLEDISNRYPMELIYQVFQEAYDKKAQSLAWIKSHLKKESEVSAG